MWYVLLVIVGCRVFWFDLVVCFIFIWVLYVCDLCWCDLAWCGLLCLFLAWIWGWFGLLIAVLSFVAWGVLFGFLLVLGLVFWFWLACLLTCLGFVLLLLGVYYVVGLLVGLLCWLFMLGLLSWLFVGVLLLIVGSFVVWIDCGVVALDLLYYGWIIYCAFSCWLNWLVG